ncbi:MAG: hypothetical protein R6U28_13140 [Cyclonatronaceae bacterium]
MVEKSNRQKKKWNYVFIESLKMALLLPLIILFAEVFILETWPGIRESPLLLLIDYVFLFSMIFLLFVVYHLIYWQRYKRHDPE